MQILVNLENGGTCIPRWLLEEIYWIMLNRLVINGLLAYSPICGSKKNCGVAYGYKEK